MLTCFLSFLLDTFSTLRCELYTAAAGLRGSDARHQVQV